MCDESEVKKREQKTDGKSSGEGKGTYTFCAGRSEGGNRVEAIRQAALPQIERRSRLSNRALTGHPVIGNFPCLKFLIS